MISLFRFSFLCLALVLAACNSGSSSSSGSGQAPVAPPVVPIPDEVQRCGPETGSLHVNGEVGSSDAKTYKLLPFGVLAGTGRVEVSYGWSEGGPLNSTPLTGSTLDLGLWDADGYREAEGFRGWSGNRQGRLDGNNGPVFVSASSADRGYFPGAIEAGVWHVELGVGAVGPQGATWEVQIDCLAEGGATPAFDPVDANHVANPNPGWYHGDFHMHGYHSNPNAPDWEDFIAQSRAANLDFLMVTEYVTGRHWQTLGPVQRANPDLLIWPGREIITYFGHANTFGETPEVLEYRHGFEDVSLGDIQRDAVAGGALFGVNHPTTFEGPLLGNFCRGCAFELEDEIDWALVDTLEIQNGPAHVTSGELGLDLPLPIEVQNPFTLTALQYWDDLLRQGFFPTAVSGSDSKGVDAEDERERKGYGSSVTAVYANSLSRAALTEAIRAGHAYIRTLGVERSPEVAFTIETGDGQSGIYGDTVIADSATLTTRIRGGQGQLLSYIVDGLVQRIVPVTGEDFSDSWEVSRGLTAGPLGTSVRIQVASDVVTVIGNPVFLAAAP